MTSAAERLAANMNFSVLGRATELKKRLWFVLGALVVYRIGTYIPVPGIDPVILSEIFAQLEGGVVGMFNMFAGGALSRMTIFALAVFPYITASIGIQILSSGAGIKHLADLKKEGTSGRQKLNQYTRYATCILAIFQGYGMATWLETMTAASGTSAVIDPGFWFRFTATISLVGGAMFLMWLGEQITQRGIGNGISLIIFAGIVAGLPSAFGQVFELGRTGAMSTPFILFILVAVLALIAFIVFMERAQRRILVQYPKRQVGNQLMKGENTHLPLKVNMSGVIPPIFASAMLLMPTTIIGFMSDGGNASGVLGTIGRYLAHGQPVFIALYAAMIIFFCFFYTAMVHNPEETADNLKKNGGFIAGIRPGKQTADYLDYVMTRLTVVGAAYLTFVCVLPEIFVSKYSVPFQLGGTGLLIVVTVVIDFVAQVQSHLFAHQYEGLINKSKLGGRGKNKGRRR